MMDEIAEDAVITLADSLPDTVFLVDVVGKIRYVNAAGVATLGYAQADIIGQSMIELVVPVDRDKTRKEARHVLAGRKRVGFENRYRHGNGSDIHLSWSAGWLEPHRLRIGVARDVTALRQSVLIPGGVAVPMAMLKKLAPYEQRVLQLLLTDASEKQIADRLGLATSTTHSYVTGILRKLGVRGRIGLMSLCLRGMAND
jgi:PAS domain S-box-containing protein